MAHVEEIVFLVKESEEGGYTASALNESICTEAATIEELKAMAHDAVLCHFGHHPDCPKKVVLHLVK